MQLTDYALSHNRPNLDANGYQLRVCILND